MTGQRVLVLVVACVMCLPAFGASNRRDGNWWRGRSELAKVEYMIGVFDGMELGYHFSYWGMKQKSGELDVDHAKKVMESYDAMEVKYFKNVTNLQLSEGLDKFYGSSEEIVGRIGFG